jgi:lipoprotein-anchoring transpeptidase ErfK/SrfK
MTKSAIRILCCALAAALLLSGCLFRIPLKSTATPAPSPMLTDTPSATPDPTPKPTLKPTPIPTPTPTPFTALAPSTAMSFEELVADDGTREKPPDPATLPPTDTYRIEVDLTNQIITVYTRGPDNNYDVPYRYMICSTGKNGYWTPSGNFHLGTHKVRFGLFVDFGVYAQYWTQVTGSIYFHSILYGTRDGRHLHKDSYRNLGRRVSHGCIRLLVPDAKWIYENCAPGTYVTITKKEPNPELKAKLKPAAIPK